MVTALWTMHRLSAEEVEIGLVILRMHGAGGGMWGGGMWGGTGWMFTLIMILFWLLILLALAGGVYWLFSRLFSNNSPRSSASETRAENPTEEALNILNERYARGEIDDEEYASRKRKMKAEE